MAKTKIAWLDDYQGVATESENWNRLPASAELQIFKDHLVKEEDLVERLKEYQVICLMRERTPFTKSLLSQLPQLKLLVTTGPGNASVDSDACRALGIKFSHTIPKQDLAFVLHSTVEVAWWLILSCAKNAPLEHFNVCSGKWQTTVGRDLLGSTLGIFGLGGIGSAMVPIAKAFGMKVVAWSQNLTEENCREKGVEKASSLVDLAKRSDFLTIHQRASPRTKGVISKEVLEALGPRSFIINTSRGPIIEEDALVEALQNKKLGGAGLDVFNVEPLPQDHPFRTLPNVIATPHIGYGTEGNYKDFFESVLENLQAYLKDGTVLNQIV